MIPFAGVPADIIGLIRSTPTPPRQRAIPDKILSEIRTAVEKYIKNTYFKRVQAPIGVKAVLKDWMELGSFRCRIELAFHP